jgi:hypothetical protein
MPESPDLSPNWQFAGHTLHQRWFGEFFDAVRAAIMGSTAKFKGEGLSEFFSLRTSTSNKTPEAP